MKMSERFTGCSTTTEHTLAKQATIILVDDDDRARRALFACLQRPGYEVVGVETVEEADKCITRRGSENIALIVSDIHWRPDSKELERYVPFQRWIAEYPDLPLILISGDHRTWNLPAVRSGAVCCLAKPFNLYDLLSAVQSALSE